MNRNENKNENNKEKENKITKTKTKTKTKRPRAARVRPRPLPLRPPRVSAAAGSCTLWVAATGPPSPSPLPSPPASPSPPATSLASQLRAKEVKKVQDVELLGWLNAGSPLVTQTAATAAAAAADDDDDPEPNPKVLHFTPEPISLSSQPAAPAEKEESEPAAGGSSLPPSYLAFPSIRSIPAAEHGYSFYL